MLYQIRYIATALIACGVLFGANAPVKKDSFRFGVIGDSGTGEKPAMEIGKQMHLARSVFPFDTVVMLGDNLYGRERPKDYVSKFERPFQDLLNANVKFHASLGNHDNPSQIKYKLFNMNGERYYSFSPAQGIRFFALDSTYMDRNQLAWVEKELAKSTEAWKICFFHHPLYSSGERHGPSVELRGVLEPLFRKYGVSLVLQGHEHFYERLKPQNGIHYIIAGGSSKIRKNNIKESELTAKGYDQDRSFVLMEIAGDELHFQAINRHGEIVDSGTLERSAGDDR